MRVLVNLTVKGTSKQHGSTSVDSYRFEGIKIERVKFAKIVILWGYETIPFGFNLCFDTFWASVYIFPNYFVVEGSGEGSVPEMHICMAHIIN